MKLYTINTGLFKLDGGAMFGVVPKTLWQKVAPADENNLVTLAMRCLLVEDGNRLILIDTGIGNKQSEKFFSHYHLHGNDTLDNSLTAYGFSRADITDVFLTHLHLDHVGGAVTRESDRLTPAFKNATYWSNKRHWAWATVNPNPREKASFIPDNLLPLQESGQLRFVDVQDHTSFTGNMQVRFVSGHTESMMLPLLYYKGKHILYVADLFPTVAHLPLVYTAAYDSFPVQAMQEKQAFLEEAIRNDYIFYFEHDALTECCTLQQTEKGNTIKDTFKLTDL